MKTFNDYKRDINLVEFAQTYGYRINKQKSTKTAVVLQDSGKFGDTIIVRYSKENQRYYYNNPNDARDKGDIINFVTSRNGWDFKQNARQINEELSKYTGDFVPEKWSIQAAPDEPRKDTVKKYFAVQEFTDRGFLHSRGITDETIDSEIFKNRVFNSQKVDKDSGAVFVNTAFPMYSESGEVVGVEIKNNGFKGNELDSDKSNSLWFSNLHKGNKIDEFIIGESAVDLMSHYQLNKEALKHQNVLYISTSGNMGHGQVDFIQKLINVRQPDQLRMAFDNDPAGVRFQCNLLGSLSLPKTEVNQLNAKHDLFSNNDVNVRVDLKGKYHVVATFDIAGKDTQEAVDKMAMIDSKLLKGLEDQDLQINILQAGEKKTRHEAQFKNNMSNMLFLENLIKEVRDLDKFVVIDRPVLKDFNDDLKAESGIGELKAKLGFEKGDLGNSKPGMTI